MKRCLLSLFTLLFCVLLASTSALAQVAGDYGSIGNGNWGTDGTNWKVFVSAADWSDATAAPGAPTSTINVWIRSGTTVTLESSSKNCANLTVESGAILTSSSVNLSSAYYITVYGSSVQVSGTLGDITKGLGFNVKPPTTLTISGSGPIILTRLRPSSSTPNKTVVFDANITFNYVGSVFYPQANDGTIFTINAGRTITVVDGGFVAVSTSGTADPASNAGANTTFNVYGTLSLGMNSNFNLRNYTGKTTTLNVYSGGVINIGGSILAPSATLGSVTATFASGSLINFNGTGASTLDLSKVSSPALSNLTINNAAGVTLGGSIGVNDNLTMTQGNIALGGNTLTLGTAIASAGSLNYTAGYLTGTGTFTRWINSTAVISGTQGLFPMGVGTKNRSLAIGGTPSTGGPIAVSYNDANTVSSIAISENAQSFVNRYDANWVVIPSGGYTDPAMTLTIHGDGIPGITSVSDLDLSAATTIATGVWAAPSGTITAPVLTRNGLTQGTIVTNPFYIASTITSALPIEMTSFTASMQSASCAILKWSTATEVNNNGFEIQRRVEGTSIWAKVGFVSGAGTSNSLKEYKYQDVNLAPGVYVYRIKQIDNDGAFKYSASTQVDLGVAKGLELLSNYPNPFNPETNLRFSVPEDGFASLKVFNMLGQEVATLFSGMAQAGHYIPTTFSAGKMASGIYFSRLEYNGKSIVQRMLLTK